MKKNIAMTLVTSLGLFAGFQTQKDVKTSITAYENIALIHEKSKVLLPERETEVIYKNVPGKMIVESVIPSFSGEDTKIKEQDFRYDTANLNSLLKSYLGKKVTIIKQVGYKEERTEGILLTAHHPVLIQNEKTGEIETFVKGMRFAFPKPETPLAVSPSLVWKVSTSSPGEKSIDISYLTKGIKWKAQYAAELSDKTLSLVGWFDLTNTSGVSYSQTSLSFIAGSVGLIRKPMPRPMYKRKMLTESIAVSANLAPESLSGYYIYRLPGKYDIRDKSQKQIPFLSASEVEYKRYGFLDVSGSLGIKEDSKLTFQQMVEIKTQKDSGLNAILPKGVIRFYSSSKDGERRFIGETNIGNTPKGEKLKLQLGELMDATGNIKVLMFKNNKYYLKVKDRVTVNNRGDSHLELRIKQSIPDYGGDKEITDTCSNECTVTKSSAFSYTYTIKLPPHKSYSFERSFKLYKD